MISKLVKTTADPAGDSSSLTASQADDWLASVMDSSAKKASNAACRRSGRDCTTAATLLDHTGFVSGASDEGRGSTNRWSAACSVSPALGGAPLSSLLLDASPSGSTWPCRPAPLTPESAAMPTFGRTKRPAPAFGGRLGASERAKPVMLGTTTGVIVIEAENCVVSVTAGEVGAVVTSVPALTGASVST